MATIRREIIRSQPQMPVAQAVPTSLPSYEGGEEKNKGGLIGGVGYLGEKVAVGTVQSIEGIFDYTLGGVAKLFGFDKFAERQFANDWFGDWYDHPDEWFNPGKGWQVAGDIAGGIGTSLPTLAVGLGTGGAGLAMFGVAGLSAAGNATKEAYRETGKLGGREFAYGALTGALEGSLETITNLVGMGTGAVIKSFGKSLGKEFTESALRQGVGITLAKAFGGEAVEEGVAEIMSSRFKRWTYDSDAEHANMGQILYASFVGGMSGVIMGGAGTVFSTAQNISRGTQLVEAGKANDVIEHAKYISEKAKKGGIEVGAMKQVEATYNKLVKSLEKTGGEVKTVAQRQMLGELKIDNIAAELSPPMYKTVAAIAKDPDTFVEKLNAYGYTDSNGNAMTVTKEQLMEGLDVNNLKGTIPTALETNEVLRDIVLMSMAGEMMINTSKFQESVLRGEKFAGDADLENFLRVASPDEVKSVEKLLGIKDLRTVDAETFNERVAAFQASGQYDEYLARYNAEKTASAEAVNAEDNANIEQNTANPTEESTIDNERRALPKEEENASSAGEETEQNTSESSDGDVMMTLVDSMKFAKENVPEYKSLNADDQAKIRRLIRQAKANGFTDAQTRAYARVSARSGIDIVIGKEGLYLGKTETGADKYSDGVYSNEKNKIIINPEGTRSPARVLIHELTHAIYKAEDGKLILEEGAKKLSDDEKTRIIAKYFKNKKFDPVEYNDELNAHYVEAMLDDEALLEKLCEDNPTLPDKILSFFKKAITGYSDEPTLSREAKKLYKRYKTLFEMFAEKNQYGDVKGEGEERHAYAGKKAKTADMLKLETAIEMLDNGVDSETVRKETGWFKGYDGEWRFEIDDSSMKFSKNGFNPDYLRYKELELKFIEGTISNQELQELQNTPKDIKNISLHRLDQFIKHDALFEAYPELKSLRVSFYSNLDTNGAFYPNTFSIKINPKAPNIEKTLLHEIQHAVQHLEGFASGADVKPVPQEVKNRLYILKEEQKKVSKELDEIYSEIGFDEYSRSLWDKAWNMEIDPDSIETLEEEFLAEKSRKGLALYNYQKQIIEMVKETMREESAPYEEYMSTAGEIEARDTASRSELNAEQRKNTRPDIDRTDVVFAENSLISKDFAGWTADGNERNAIAEENITEENLAKTKAKKEELYKKISEAKKTADSLKDSEREKALMDLITLKTPKDVLENAISEYKKWQDESGYSAAYDELSELEKQLREVQSEEEQIERGLSKQLLNKEHANEEIAAYATKAARKFHTTSRLKLAGYLTTNGSMLDFSQGQGYRVRDHREISEILDLPEYAGYSDGMIVFMNMGNIRLQTYGIDIAAMPNTKQITALRSIIPEVMREYDEFTVDFSTKNGYTDGSVTYPRGTATTRIISDIKSYFETGVVPEEPSNLAQFRYALPDEDFDVQATLKKGTPRKLESGMTVGVMKKAIANSAHYKVYSKESALKVINSMSGTYQLTAKTRDELAQSLWQGLNDCIDAASRETFAQDMAEFITAKLINDAKIENPDVQEAAEKMSYLSTYIGKLSFSPEYISDIKHLVGKSGMKILSGRWGYKGKGNRRVPMDVFVSDISREMPAMAHLEDMHPVEAFLELNSIYQTVKDTIKDKWISAYWDMPDAEVKSLMSSIKVDILNAFIAEGEESRFSKILNNKIEYYENKAAKWKKERDNIAGRNKILGNLMSLAQKMKDLRYGNFANATQADNETFKNSIEKLAKINYRGNLPVNTTRKVMGELLTWYNKENALLEYVDDKNSGYYVQSVADMLEYLSKDENKNFSKDDLLILRDVMSYFINFVETYNKVFRDGKLVDAIPLAQKYYDIAKENANTKVGIFAKFGGSWYTELFGNPASVVRRMDYYNNGFFTEIFGDVRSAAVDAEISEMEVMKSYDDFLNSNKKYIEEATIKTVEYGGVAIPKIQLIDLYMTMKRKHAWLGIAQNGFTFTDLDGKRVRVGGLTDNAELTELELEKIIQRQRTEIEKHFDAKDKEYMSILEEGYNEKARKLKADRDMQRLGYTNAANDYYYPIRRAYLAKNVDVSDAQAEYDRVTNSSFNKDIVKGAKQELAIESADARYRRHIHAVCQYAYLSPAIEAYNRLYNLDLDGNKNRPESIRTATENTWAKGNKYFSKLISDIQGIPAVSSEGMQALSFVRGAYAKFQLGANPKVWFTQLSSIFASSSVLDADSISKGVFLASGDADKYCGLAKLRSYDNTAVMAQAVIDRQGKALSKSAKVLGKTSKFSDVLMKPIGMVDKFVIERLFGACQVQIEKNGGAKVGTERNKIEAGKLLKNVILETQQNSIATERSAAMRSGNEIVRTLTMFSSDSMKVVGRVIDSFGEISVLKQRIKATADTKAKADLEAKLKEAQKKAAKSSTALVTSAIFMALIAQGFRWLYNKDKEDESVVKTMTVDAVGNMFGGLPLIRDVYSRIFEGYGFDNFTYSSINDLLDSAISLMDSSADIISGEATNQDIARGIKNITYSVGQLTGLPTRNVYNVLYGLTKRVSPTAAYKIDTAFYKKNYENDLYKAIEDGDAKMANFILGLLYNERTGTDMSEQTFNETLSLISKGYKVMPKAIPSTVTIAGAEYELNDTEKTALSKYYEDAQAPLRKLFEKSEYRNMSDEQKAEAINYVYNLQYKKKLVDLFGISDKTVTLSYVISTEDLAILRIATKGLTSDVDKKGNVVSGSKRKKVVATINALDIPSVQKALLICAQGYTLQSGDVKGVTEKKLLSYILKLNTSKQVKENLAKLCGFEVKNGKIVIK